MCDKLLNLLCEAILIVENLIIHLVMHICWPHDIDKKQSKVLCVYKPGNIGDLMCAIPGLNEIRKYYQNSRIVLLTHGGNSANASVVLKGLPVFDDISIFNAGDLHSKKGIDSIVRQVKKLDADYMIIIPPENAGFLSQLKHLFIFSKCGLKSTRGFSVSYFSHFNRAQYKYRRFDREVIRVLKALPFKYESVDFSYPISDEDKQVVKDKLLESGLTDKKILLVSPIGKAPANSWPPEAFHKIITKWKYSGGEAILIGGHIDKDTVDKICGGESYDFSGKLSIQQSLYLMTRCEILLTIDTGTAHMASVAGIKCIGLYSSRNMPEQWFPYGVNVTVLTKTMPCSPCRMKVCPKQNMCMKAISVDNVWSAIVEKENTK